MRSRAGHAALELLSTPIRPFSMSIARLVMFRDSQCLIQGVRIDVVACLMKLGQ
jgi:hypothetical protein